MQTLEPQHSAVVGGVSTPVRTATWTYYDDAHQTTYSAEGYVRETSVGSGVWTVFTLANPVSVTKYNANGQTTDKIQAALAVSGGVVGWASSPTTAASEVALSTVHSSQDMQTFLAGLGAPSQSSYAAWTTYQYSHTHLASTRDYYSIPVSGAGTTANYDQTTYTYDNRNRLVEAVDHVFANGNWSTKQVDYTYDIFNRLIARTVSGTGAGSQAGTQRFVYDGTNAVLAFDGSSNLTDRYLWGPAVDQVLADENFSALTSSQRVNGLPQVSGTTKWTLSDNQNTVRDLVGDDGTPIQHIAYTPFGQQLVLDNGAYVAQVAFAFGYTGTYTDVVTGDQLHDVRWYDPASQRWLTQDPLGLGPDSNPYRYCGNGPGNGTDPSGEEQAATKHYAISGVPQLGTSLTADPLYEFHVKFENFDPAVKMVQVVTHTISVLDKEEKIITIKGAPVMTQSRVIDPLWADNPNSKLPIDKAGHKAFPLDEQHLTLDEGFATQVNATPGRCFLRDKVTLSVWKVDVNKTKGSWPSQEDGFKSLSTPGGVYEASRSPIPTGKPVETAIAEGAKSISFYNFIFTLDLRQPKSRLKFIGNSWEGTSLYTNPSNAKESR